MHSGGGDYHVLASVMSYIIRRLTLTHFVRSSISYDILSIVRIGFWKFRLHTLHFRILRV